MPQATQSPAADATVAEVPFVSVVIALYNEEDNLEMCTASVLKQTYPKDRFEVLLVNDGSEDDSEAICRAIVARTAGQLPEMRYLPIAHAGLSAARNQGIAEGRGELIAFLDADAAAREDWLERLVEAFSDARVGAVGGRIDPLNAESRLAHFFAAIHYDRSPVIGANMAYRREVFSRIGGFCPVFTFRGDEANLIRRVRRQTTFEIRRAPGAAVDHLLPGRLRAWLRERWVTGRLWHLHRVVNRASGTEDSARQDRVALVKRLLNLSLVPALVALVLAPGALTLAWFGIAALAVVYRYVVPGALGRELWRSLRARNGVPGASLLLLPAVAATQLGTLADDLAWVYYLVVREPWPSPAEIEIPQPAPSS